MTDQACNFADGRRVEDKAWVANNLNSVVEYIVIKSPMAPTTKTYTEFLQSGGSTSTDVIGFQVLYNHFMTKFQWVSLKKL